MIQYRHELKLSINTFDKITLSSRLSHILKKDEHTGVKGYYVVRSLYFDDLNDSALQAKLLGYKYREKFRIRTYDGSTSLIRLEKKVKDDKAGYKIAAALTPDECQDLLKGEYQFLKSRPEMVCRQLYCKMRTGLFKPKTIVQYNREAYQWDPGRIRITIDSNIQTGINSVDFLNFSIPLAGVLDNGVSLLEIKYNDFLPAHIGRMLQMESRKINSHSKYVLSRRFS